MTTAQAGYPGGQPVITVTRGLATPAEIAAIQEDASVVGLSVLSGAHLTATGTAEGKVPA
jgi:methylmalonyl-CoA mutase cobalamin-binding subunit